MDRLTIRLFGRLSILCGDEPVEELRGSKVQELLCYLLLHRDRPHGREFLANLLWGDTPTPQSRKYLRQALWQLQTALQRHESTAGRTLLVDSDWVHLNTASGLWLDVAAFGDALALASRARGAHLDDEGLEALRTAVGLYRGELLEGWYQDWCLRERERLQVDYIAILDKLMAHCEARELFDEGLKYGSLVLRCDRAHESTHQRLMRMHYLAGDRATALRQYDRCIIALDEELGVKPSEATATLYERLRDGAPLSSLAAAALPARPASDNAHPGPLLSDVLSRLREVERILAETQQRLRIDISAVEQALAGGVDKSPTAAMLSRPSSLRPLRRRVANGGATRL